MELAKIEKLLEQYLEAKTTLEEEKILKDYFLKNDVPPHLNEYKKLFNYFIISSLDASDKTISLPKNKSIINWLAIAAMAVFFVGIYSVYQNNINERKQAELAYMETQRALELISFNLNKGNNAIAKLQTFENTQNKIFKIN